VGFAHTTRTILIITSSNVVHVKEFEKTILQEAVLAENTTKQQVRLINILMICV
jgi:hypothetical protein